VTYCFALSIPTTVSHVYSRPASWPLLSYVLVFRIASYCMLVEFLPGRNEVTRVVSASTIPTWSLTSADPSWGRRDSGSTFKWRMVIS
jgi:hypothetical protein